MVEILKSYFDFRQGIQNRRQNPLDVDERSLVNGLNIDLSDGALRTRPGYSVVSSGSLPAGEVMAIQQVRFPTNEMSRIVVQCSDFTGTQTVPYVPPDESEAPAQTGWPHICYDTYRDRVWAFWDTPGTPCYYDVTTKTWYEITNATNQPVYVWGEVVYDPGRDYIWGIGSIGDWETYAHWVWYYDIEGNTFGGYGTTFETWNLIGNSIRGHKLFYDDVTDALYAVMGESLTGSSHGNYGTDTLYKFDCTSHADSLVSLSGGIGVRGVFSFAWDSGNRKGLLVGGAIYDESYDNPVGSKEAWILDLAGLSWTQVASVPVSELAESPNENLVNYVPYITLSPDNPDWVSCAAVMYCSGNWYCIGNANCMNLDSLSECSYVWSYGEAAWVRFDIGTVIPPRITQGVISDLNGLLILGYYFDAGQGWPPSEISGVEILTDLCTDVVGTVPDPGSGGDYDATNYPSRLWASDDHLPTTTMVFTEIYDFETQADRVSVATLNDRAVITEGRAARPLVWGSAMSTDGSDWMSPKAVLATQDGEHHYDVSAEVCDKDPDTVADIGLIQANGYLSVCTDMPNVSGFYFEMAVANTVDEQSTDNQQTLTLSYFDETTVAVEDLKGTVDDWAQDSGATGHFEDAGNTPLTLGPGNTCPDVEPGLNVVFSANELTIVDITDDGEGTGEVELSETISSQSVDSIIGLSAESGALISPSGFSPAVSSWSKTPNRTFGGSGFSVRQIISGADISTSGDQFRISLNFPFFNDGTSQTGVWSSGVEATLRGSTHHPLAYVIAKKQWIMVSRISIGERDGSTANTVELPTPITFQQRPNYASATGSYSFATHPTYGVTTSDGTLFLSICLPFITGGTTVTSDWINFAIDETKDYIVIFDCMDVWIRNYTRSNPLGRSDGAGYYFASGEANAPETWNVSDVSAYGFTLQEGFTVGAIEIETRDKYPLPTQLLSAHSTDDSQLSILGIENFRRLEPQESKPGSTSIYHAVSLDARSTFQIWDGTAWRVIVKNSGVWQYLDGSDVWQNASADNLLRALKEAFAVTENQMTGETLAALTSTEWLDTGGIELHITSTLDFACGMLCDTSDTPILSGYLAVYNDAGETAIQGYAGNKWTAGEGWTDGTRLNDVPWGQSGVVTYDGATAFEAQYHVLNGVPGYWFRFKSNGTAEGTSIARVLYKGPCQPLANIGDGQPDICLAAIFHDVSTDVKKDITIEVSGARGSFTVEDDGTTTYVAGRATIPMQTADYLYVGYPSQFNQIEFEPDDGYPNAVDATLTGEYWNGKEWVVMDIVDETVGTDEDHIKTLSTTGKVSWFLPSDWKMTIPINGNFYPGYYVRFQPSANLTATTTVDELRVYPVPKDLPKHKFAVAFRDRIALVGRPDAPDRIDICRALEEYGFTGADSGSYRVGGQDAIASAWSAWNGLWLGKVETLHQLLGNTPADFQWQGVEAAALLPINNRVIVKAPSPGFGQDGSRYSVLYINAKGAYVSSGAQVDNSFSSSRTNGISEGPNWWTEDTTVFPRLDLANLHKSCGGYHAGRNWAVWAVPMLLNAEQSSQPTNNRLLVYDLTLGAWLTPFDIAVSSMCLAYDYSSTAPGHIGPASLLAGTYDGQVIRLFDGVDDAGTDIAANAETGWLHLGEPNVEKRIRYLTLFGKAEGNITLSIYVDGNETTPVETRTISGLTTATSRFLIDMKGGNIWGTFYKIKCTGTDIFVIYGIQLEVDEVRPIRGDV